jgi:hypothetical protein
MMHEIYGDEIEFTIHVDSMNEGLPFLDTTVSLDHHKQAIRLKTYSKPQNARDLTRESSNVPRTVLKPIVVGMLKRYIIVNDTAERYAEQREELFNVLCRQGWSRRELAKIRKPSYGDRMRDIEAYMDRQAQRKREYLIMHSSLDMFDCPPSNPNLLITKKPAFNRCFDRVSWLTRNIELIRAQHLPTDIKSIKHIIANRGAVKLQRYFDRNGM